MRCQSIQQQCQPRHRFLEPIHNVKEGPNAPNPRDRNRGKLWSSSLENVGVRLAMLDRAPHGLRVAMVEPIGIEPMTSSLQS